MACVVIRYGVLVIWFCRSEKKCL